MATQIIEFGFDAGETVSIVATPVDDIETEFTANTVTEIRGGLFQASFVDQEMATGLYRFEAVDEADVVLGRGMVNITAAAGTFRETVESTVAVDTSGIADDVLEGISEGGVAVASGTPAFIAQLRAANIIFRNNAPQMGPMTLFSGCDHLQANGNGKSFRNPAGTWPLTGRTIYLEVTVSGKSTRDEGVILVETGEEQEIICQMRRQVLVDADILFGTGHYLVVAETAEGERFPIRGGELEVSYGVKPEA